MKWGRFRRGDRRFPFGASTTLGFSILLMVLPGRAAVVATCDEAALRAAISQGGTVTFACDGTIALSNTIVIASDVVLDGTDRNVTISGNNAVRLFQVQSGVSFGAVALALVSGRTNAGAGIYNDG